MTKSAYIFPRIKTAAEILKWHQVHWKRFLNMILWHYEHHLYLLRIYNNFIFFLFSWNLYFLSQFQIDDLSYLHKNKEWTDGCLTKYCLLNVDIIDHYVWPFIEVSKTIQTRKKNIVPEYNIGVIINELDQIDV